MSLLSSLTTSYETGAGMRGGDLLGVERQRRWTGETKLSILREVGQSGWSLTDVALRHDLTRQHICAAHSLEMKAPIDVAA